LIIGPGRRLLFSADTKPLITKTRRFTKVNSVQVSFVMLRVLND
jgi:hypothetical protein